MNYYNEIDPYAAQWLRNLIDAGHIAPGVVDERSIEDVIPNELDGYTQCHFFAGLGGWSLALRLAGWPDSRPIWTGSCPCQPFSVAGAGAGSSDKRHLWPAWFHLIAQCKPSVVLGEQVAAAVGKHWLDGVCADMEGRDYAIGASVLPACSVGAPHKRDRLWFVADTNIASTGEEREQRGRELGRFGSHTEARFGGYVADSDSIVGQQRSQVHQGCDSRGHEVARSGLGSDGSFWRGAERVIGHDGKARRVKPGIRLLAHGVPARVGKLRAYGNAIVPEVAAAFIESYVDARGIRFDVMEQVA